MRIVTISEPPFFCCGRDCKNCDTTKPVNRSEVNGYLMELLEGIQEAIGNKFEYELEFPVDGKYGSINAEGEWNGAVSMIINDDADIVLANLAITTEREKAIDFTAPFFADGLNILAKFEERSPEIFAFLNPFAIEVWLVIFGSIIILGIVLHYFDFSEDEEGHTMIESIWFIFAAMVGGGTESVPQSTPARILTSFWWFVSMTFLSTYTAKLAALLTKEHLSSPFSNIHELVGQSNIKYGTIADSAVHDFFKANDVFHHAMGKMTKWHRNESVFVDSEEVAMKRVRDGNYAFIWSASTNKYLVGKKENCDLVTVGDSFAKRSYAIGVRPGANYRNDISLAILRLKERGFLHDIEYKWFHNSSECPKKVEGTKQMSLDHLKGVFIILSMGIGVCILLFLAEKLHAQVLSWKDGGGGGGGGVFSWKDAGSQDEEASISEEAPNFRSDYASFANSLVATSFTAAQINAIDPLVTCTTTATNDGAAVPLNSETQLEWKLGNNLNSATGGFNSTSRKAFVLDNRVGLDSNRRIVSSEADEEVFVDSGIGSEGSPSGISPPSQTQGNEEKTNYSSINTSMTSLKALLASPKMSREYIFSLTKNTKV